MPKLKEGNNGIGTAVVNGWTWYVKLPAKTAVEEITGKYLFFSPDKEKLVKVIESEFLEHGFEEAKIPLVPAGEDYVLCLYYKDDSRKHELAERHQTTEGVRYRYWKSDAATRAGIYSKEFLDRQSKDG